MRKKTAKPASNPVRSRRNDVSCIGAHADYRREDYVFQRTQSLEMQKMEWLDRLPPMKSWGGGMFVDLAQQLFA